MCEFDLPIKPHLRKYLFKRLNIESGSTIPISFTDKLGFGYFITAYLTNKRSFNYWQYKSKIENYTKDTARFEIVTIKLKHHHVKENDVNITLEGIYFTNKWLENIFRLELFTFIHTQFLFYPRIDVNYAIGDFLSIYDITENELSRETVYRSWSRYKKDYSYIE